VFTGRCAGGRQNGVHDARPDVPLEAVREVHDERDQVECLLPAENEVLDNPDGRLRVVIGVVATRWQIAAVCKDPFLPAFPLPL